MLALTVSLVLLLPTTWIVDQSNGPGTNFTDLPQAVAAAASGDTIIVRAGSYTPFNVTGKALTILGAGAASTTVSLPLPSGVLHPQTRIEGVPAGSNFYISGMRFSPISFPPPGTAWSTAGLEIVGSAGAVVLSGVEVFGAHFPPGSSGNPALVVSGGEVHASHCTFVGAGSSYAPAGSGGIVTGVIVADASTFNAGSGFPQSSPGGTGLFLAGGVASLARSSAIGGTGGYAAGAGVSVASGAFLRAAGTSADTFQGGAILIGPGMTFGMPAVYVAGPAGSAVIHGNITLIPGPTASPTSGAVTIGAFPLPYLAITGTATASGDLDATQPVTVVMDGSVPSAPFILAVDFAPDFATTSGPILIGELLVPIPAPTILQGTLNALGMAQITTTPAVSAPSFVGIPLYAQFGVIDAVEANIRLSNGLICRFQ
jgi:hypothetical protein